MSENIRGHHACLEDTAHNIAKMDPFCSLSEWSLGRVYKVHTNQTNFNLRLNLPIVNLTIIFVNEISKLIFYLHAQKS